MSQLINHILWNSLSSNLRTKYLWYCNHWFSFYCKQIAYNFRFVKRSDKLRKVMCLAFSCCAWDWMEGAATELEIHWPLATPFFDDTRLDARSRLRAVTGRRLVTRTNLFEGLTEREEVSAPNCHSRGVCFDFPCQVRAGMVSVAFEQTPVSLKLVMGRSGKGEREKYPRCTGTNPSFRFSFLLLTNHRSKIYTWLASDADVVGRGRREVCRCIQRKSTPFLFFFSKIRNIHCILVYIYISLIN